MIYMYTFYVIFFQNENSANPLRFLIEHEEPWRVNLKNVSRKNTHLTGPTGDGRQLGTTDADSTKRHFYKTGLRPPPDAAGHQPQLPTMASTIGAITLGLQCVFANYILKDCLNWSIDKFLKQFPKGDNCVMLACSVQPGPIGVPTPTAAPGVPKFPVQTLVCKYVNYVFSLLTDSCRREIVNQRFVYTCSMFCVQLEAAL